MATFPRHGKYFIGAPFDYDVASVQAEMAKMDILVWNWFPSWGSGSAYDQAITAVKAINPNVEVWVYFNPSEVPITANDWQPIRNKMAAESGAGGQGDWYARDAGGVITGSSGFNTYFINGTEFVTADASGFKAIQWQMQWFYDNAISVEATGADGFFLDNLRPQPMGNADFDEDGTNDNKDDADVVASWRTQWVSGIAHMLSLKPALLKTGNIQNWARLNKSTGDSISEYHGMLHGGVIEHITGKDWSQEGYYYANTTDSNLTYNGWGGFDRAKDIIQFYNGILLDDKLIVNARGPITKYRHWRYAMAFTVVLSNWLFDYSDQTKIYGNIGHHLDEEEAGTGDRHWLGTAIDPPQSSTLLNNDGTNSGIYGREFQKGFVLVNPPNTADKTQPENGSRTWTSARLNDFERFSGTQDPSLNDGSSVFGSITLGNRSGIFLKRIGTLDQVATPTFNPIGGTYSSAQDVAITSSTSGVDAIHYTTNGNTPTTGDASIANGGTVNVATNLTLKAIAVKSGLVDSNVASANYTISGTGSETGAIARINVGGPSYLDSSGNTWTADDGFNIGILTGNPNKTILNTNTSGTADAEIYKSHRYNSDLSTTMEYTRTGLADGTYDAWLHYAETNDTLNFAGARVFDVKINNTLVDDDLDIYVAAGNAGDTAVVRKHTGITVSGGTLKISWPRVAENPFIFGIELFLASDLPFQQGADSQNLLSMEAENYHVKIPQGGGYDWVETTANAGFSGTAALISDPTTDPESVGSTNYVTDPGFEIGDAAWVIRGTPTSSSRVNTGQIRTGSWSWFVDSDGGAEGVQQNVGGLTAGTKYRVSAWVYYLQNGNGVDLDVLDTHVDEGSAASNNTTTQGQWVELSFDATLAAGRTSMTIFIESEGVADFYVDDVSVYEIIAGTLTTADAPKLDYDANFVATGTHYLWLHGYAPDVDHDSIKYDLDDTDNTETGSATGFTAGAWSWISPGSLNIGTTGTHTINLWMESANFQIDKLVLTTDVGFTPTGTGPAESSRIIAQVPTPVASVDSGTVSSGEVVTVTYRSTATLRYTLDGSDPHTSGTVLTDTGGSEDITITGATTLWAYATESGLADSNDLVNTYSVAMVAPVIAEVTPHPAASISINLTPAEVSEGSLTAYDILLDGTASGTTLAADSGGVVSFSVTYGHIAHDVVIRANSSTGETASSNQLSLTSGKTERQTEIAALTAFD